MQHRKRNKKKRSIQKRLSNVYWQNDASSPFQCNLSFPSGNGYDLNNATDKTQRTLKRTEGKGETWTNELRRKIEIKNVESWCVLGKLGPSLFCTADPFLTPLNYSSTLSLIFRRLLLLFWSLQYVALFIVLSCIGNYLNALRLVLINFVIVQGLGHVDHLQGRDDDVEASIFQKSKL